MKRLLYILILLGCVLPLLAQDYPWMRNRNDARILMRLDTAFEFTNPRDSTIANLRYIDFDLEDGIEDQEGRMKWDDADKTLEIGLDRGSVLQMGQEVHVRCLNNSGIDITNGQAVYISGAQGSRPTIALADNDDPAKVFTTVGIATQDIDDNETGYVTMIGLVRDINTNAFPAGSILWVSCEPGELTATRPTPPCIAVVAGVVLRQNAEEGVIGARVIPVFRLAWLSDVKAHGSQSNWDFLYWNDDSIRWELSQGKLNLYDLETYADNAAAIAGGLSAGDVYRTATGGVMIVY